MANSHFQFKQFCIHQDKCAMKVTTDGCLFGAWVANNIQKQNPQNENCLDIGTGTGLLSLMVAQKNNLQIDALEIDKNAALQAKENTQASPWKENISIHNIDANLFSSNSSYDLIISNPPFYENELKGESLKKNIAHHDEGLLLPELLAIIKKKLSVDGIFYLLLPYKRTEEIKRLLLEKEMPVQHITMVRQSVNHNYFRLMLAASIKPTLLPETTIDEICIKDENNHYSPAFITLLKDYYLHL